MVELQVLALASLPFRVFQSRWGWMSAKCELAADPKRLFEFLSEIENHWRLAEGLVEATPTKALACDPRGGEVRLRGPFGLRRRAWTRLLLSLTPRLLIGRATVGRHTVARITWLLSTRRPGWTDVELSVAVERVGALDGLVLLLGGRRWLERHFEATLRVLAELFASSGEEDRLQTPKSPSEPIRC